MPPVHGEGPLGAKLFFIGEAPGADEEHLGRPFIGAAGQFLDKMLASFGILRKDVYVTNVARVRPPSLPGGGADIKAFFEHMPPPTAARPRPLWTPGPQITAGLQRLKTEIELVNPAILIPMGNVALWAVQGAQKIGTWRGSILISKPEFGSRRVVPTWHPAYILRSMGDHPQMRADIDRAVRWAEAPDEPRPRRHYIVRPTLAQVRWAIFECFRRGRFSADIETRRGEISCIGFAWGRNEGICIPFIDSKAPDGAFWSFEDELAVWQLVQWLMTSPDVEIIMQNASYEASYFAARRGWLPNVKWDTMSMHHVVFAGMEKSLDFMASMYAEWYSYWKDQGREWDVHLPEEQHWEYNIDDCCYTFEVATILIDKLLREKLMDIYRGRQDRLWWALQAAMLRGLNASKDRLAEVIQELVEYAIGTMDQVKYLLGHDINLKSGPQMQALLYEDFGLPVVLDRKTKRPTVKDEALDLCMQRQPLLKPLILRIKDYRSATTLLGQLGIGKEGEAKRGILDDDGRCRFNINMDGAETYRTSSSKNNFGTGMNGQNLTKGDDEDETAQAMGRLVAPNLRTIFVPDPGHTYADIDLKRADLVVVAKEANDGKLLEQLAAGYNPYLIATAQFLKLPVTKEGLKEAKDKHNVRYTLFKSFFHGCVAEDHEALTPQGWKRVDQIQDGEAILVCTPDGETAFFEPIQNWFRGPCHSTMIHFIGEAVDLLCTHDHKMSYTTDEGPTRQCLASALPLSARVPKAVQYSGGTRELESPCLLAAFMADGSLYSAGHVTFHLRKPHKIARLHKYLKAAGKQYSFSEKTGVFYLPKSETAEFREFGKSLDERCLTWTKASALAFLLEQAAWDGHIAETSVWMSGTREKHAQWAHTLTHLHGMGSQLRFQDRAGRKRLWCWSRNNRLKWRVSSCTKTSIPGHGRQVYCPMTTTGFWLTRRNGKITVQGNTNYGGSVPTMAANCNISRNEAGMLQAWWFHEHPGIKARIERIAAQLMGSKEVRNAFGYRRRYFDRPEGILGKALAWSPQSTVAVVSLEQFTRVHEAWRSGTCAAFPLLQVHDSILVQYPTAHEDATLRTLHRLMVVEIPFQDGVLILQPSLATSTKSWGDCADRAWPS